MAPSRSNLSCNDMPLFILRSAIYFASSIFLASSTAKAIGTENIAHVGLKGTVLNEHTSSSIVGARVLVSWHATTYGFHSSTRHCLRLEAARTDSDGKFLIAASVDDVFRTGLHNQHFAIQIYKENMSDATSGEHEDGRALEVLFDEKKISAAALLRGALLTKRHWALTSKLISSPLDAHDRMRYLSSLSKLEMDCETIGDVNSIKAYFDAIAEEANKIAITKYEKHLASNITARARMPPNRARGAGFDPDISSTFDSKDLDSRDSRDYTVLMDAAAVGDNERVKALLKAGANPNRTANSSYDLLGGDSAITIAIEKYGMENVSRPQDSQRFLAVIETLLRHSTTDPNIRRRKVDYTPLMKALERGQSDVVSLLLVVGADANIMVNSRQFGALQIATKRAMEGSNSAGVAMPSASTQFGVLLAYNKLDLNQVYRYDGHTALTQAASLANVKIVMQLLEAGADPNAQTITGQTPLIIAVNNALLNPARSNYVETVRVIANATGVRKSETYIGKTAIQLAQEGRRPDIVRILEK